jgi:predicted nucleic acid-binding Zn ribbon protein
MEYEFQCKICNHIETLFFKTLQKDLAPPNSCVKCGAKNSMESIISAPHVLYNCKGFYCTDHGNHGQGRHEDKMAHNIGLDKCKVKS